MISPCKKECKLRNNMCVACTRTLEEIKGWGLMTDEVRMKLMKEIKGQTSTHDCPECDKPTYCAMEDGKSLSACWCAYVPYKPKQEDLEQKFCLCRECLTKEG